MGLGLASDGSTFRLIWYLLIQTHVTTFQQIVIVVNSLMKIGAQIAPQSQAWTIQINHIFCVDDLLDL